MLNNGPVIVAGQVHGHIEHLAGLGYTMGRLRELYNIMKTTINNVIKMEGTFNIRALRNIRNYWEQLTTIIANNESIRTDETEHIIRRFQTEINDFLVNFRRNHRNSFISYTLFREFINKRDITITCLKDMIEIIGSSNLPNKNDIIDMIRNQLGHAVYRIFSSLINIGLYNKHPETSIGTRWFPTFAEWIEIEEFNSSMSGIFADIDDEDEDDITYEVHDYTQLNESVHGIVEQYRSNNDYPMEEDDEETYVSFMNGNEVDDIHEVR